MTRRRIFKVSLAVILGVLLICGGVVAAEAIASQSRTHVTAYFDNSNGIFPGDDVYMLGVKIGKIETIEPQPTRAKINFWYGDQYKVPADAKAVILSPQLITSRAIQLTPAYTGGPAMQSGAVIGQDRTAVPVEWDDFRQSLEKLTQSLQPGPDGVSPLGAFINTAADNLRGQGANIRDTIIRLSQAFSALGDHSGDIFSTIKNLSTLVSALHSSSDLMRELNQNLNTVTGMLASDPDAIGRALDGLSMATVDVKQFVVDNRDALTKTTENLATLTGTVVQSMDDVKQTLHVAPSTFANFINIYEPAHGSLTGALALNNFANPIQFICGAVEAASRRGADQSAKLCVQYLAPILKNRQYNFPPLGMNPFVNAQARPNEITYSEDWLRPDHRPTPAPAAEQTPAAANPADSPPPPPPQAQPAATDPAQGLTGMMVPTNTGGR